MRILLFLFIINCTIPAMEFESPLNLNSEGKGYSPNYQLINHKPILYPILTSKCKQDCTQALIALTPKRKAFRVDYGNGILTNKLEELTLILLDISCIANIVNFFSDEFETSPKRNPARIHINLNNKELKFAYYF